MKSLLLLLSIVIICFVSIVVDAATLVRYVNTASTVGGDGTTPGTTGATRAFPTLKEAEGALNTHLVDDGDIMEIRCLTTDGTADTASVIFNGWTTGISNYIKVWTDEADVYRHNGTWSTGNKYRMEITATGVGEVALQFNEEYFRADGLQIAVTNASNDNVSAFKPQGITANNDLRLGNTIIRGVSLSGAGDNVRGIFCGDADVNLTVWNCIVYDIVNGTDDCHGILFTSGNVDLINCTFMDNRQNIVESTAGVCNAYNTVAFGATDAGENWGGTWDAGNNNGTEGTDAEMPQTDRVYNVATTDFETYASDDFHLASGSNLKNQGATDPSGSGFGDPDIDGDTRSTWDIGADEFVDGAPAFIPKIQWF